MAHTVMVSVLGALRVTVGDQEIDLGGHRQQTALATLLLHQRHLPPAVMADLVWDGAPPQTASGTLYAYVARLRRVLAPTGLVIVGDRSGYHLDVPDECVDLRVFEAALTEARDLRLPEEASSVVAILGPLLERWSGPLMDGSSSGPAWLDGARSRVHAQKIQAVALLAEAELALGVPDRAVARLSEVVEEEPLQEQLVAHLMLGLHRLGRQADALNAYSSCQRALRDELGVVPGTVLRDTHQRVLRNDPGLSWTPAPLVLARAHLPPRDVRFHGRSAELVELGALLNTGRRVVCTGLGGIGKTALVVEFAHRHHGPVLWIPCESEAALATQLRSLAVQLGLLSQDMDDWLRRTWDHLSAIPDLLVVFDSVGGPELLRAYSPRDPSRIQSVITSRHAAWSGLAELLELECFAPDEAHTFLEARSPLSHELDSRRLVDELGCLPLALAQASAFMDQAALTCGEYLAIYRERRDEILGRGAPHDHPDTVRTTWTLSVEQAAEESPSAAGLLEVLAFLDAERVPIHLLRPLFERKDPALEVAEAVAQLRRFSLVRRTGDAIGMHRLLQAVVRDSLAPALGVATWATAVDLVRRAVADADDPTEARRAMTGSVHALAVHGETLQSSSTELLSMMRECSASLVEQGSASAAASLMEIAVRAAERLELAPPLLGLVHSEYADALDSAGDLAAALTHSQAALSLLERSLADDDLRLAVARTRRAHVLNCAGSPGEASVLHRRALPVLAGSGGLAYVGALVDLGYAEWGSHHLDDAAEAFGAAMEAASTPDTRRARCAATAGLGLVSQDRGDLVAALEHQESAHRLLRELHADRDHPDVGLHLDKMGFLQRLRGDLGAAGSLHDEAVAILGRCFGVRDPRVAVARSNRGLTREAAGDREGATSDHHAALDCLRAAYGETHPLTLLAAERGAQAALGERSVTR